VGSNTETYDYDIFGNRTIKATSNGALAYLYDAAHQLNQLRTGSSAGPLTSAAIHDAAGRMTMLCEGTIVTTTLSITYNNAIDQNVSATRSGANAGFESYSLQKMRAILTAQRHLGSQSRKQAVLPMGVRTGMSKTQEILTKVITCTPEGKGMIDNEVVLVAKKIYYFSQFDEAAFFEWLGKLKCVVDVRGELDELFIRVDRKNTDEYDLRELIALFHRYSISKKQLVAFDEPRFESWFKNPQVYWYPEVFQPKAI
jgi:hypothetical protein